MKRIFIGCLITVLIAMVIGYLGWLVVDTILRFIAYLEVKDINGKIY